MKGQQTLSLDAQYELMLSEWEAVNKAQYRATVQSTLKQDEKILEEEAASIKTLKEKHTELSHEVKVSYANKAKHAKINLKTLGLKRKKNF